MAPDSVGVHIGPACDLLVLRTTSKFTKIPKCNARRGTKSKSICRIFALSQRVSISQLNKNKPSFAPRDSLLHYSKSTTQQDTMGRDALSLPNSSLHRSYVIPRNEAWLSASVIASHLSFLAFGRTSSRDRAVWRSLVFNAYFPRDRSGLILELR